MTTFALSLCIVLAIAAGILANSLRNRDKELEAMAESYNALRDELTQTQAERAKAIQAKEEADKLRDRIERAAKVADQERDKLIADVKDLTNTCDDLFDTLCDAVEKMPVPFHLRQRDERGKFAKTDAFTVATNLFLKKAVVARELRNSKGQIQKLSEQ
jgi:hypothetical protein